MSKKGLSIVTLIVYLLGLFIIWFFTEFWIGSQEDYENLLASNGLSFKLKKAFANLAIVLLISSLYWMLLKFGLKIHNRAQNKLQVLLAILLFLFAICAPFILL